MLSHEAFPRGFPTGLSHVPPLCELTLGLKVEAVQGKQVSLEWTETSGGLWEWWHDPGVPLAWKGDPPGFSRVVASALDLGQGLRDPLWWPQERPVPMRVARGTLGNPHPSMPGPKILCGVGART